MVMTRPAPTAWWRRLRGDHGARSQPRTGGAAAVRDTGLGNVPDKIQKNHRKTLGLIRDLSGAKSVGVIADDAALGVTEIARPAGWWGHHALDQPGATPANMIINAMKGRNAIILAPSPKGYSTAALLLSYVHEEFDRIGAPRDLVQLLPAPVNKALTNELLQQVDLVVATGSQANIKAAYSRWHAGVRRWRRQRVGNRASQCGPRRGGRGASCAPRRSTMPPAAPARTAS